MRSEQTYYAEVRMEELRNRRLLSDVTKFIQTLERCAKDPANCPDERIIPYMEPYRLLKGSAQEVQEFLSIVMDESDPRQEIFEFVLNAMETYNAETAIQRLIREGFV